jgi:hypothetical protein
MKSACKDLRVAGVLETAKPHSVGITHVSRCDCKAGLLLTALLALFLLLQELMPLRTAVQIGADEGFELAKATLCVNGHKLYTEVWNDQPPLHTFLITQTLKHLSPSILGPRLITIAFAVLWLASIFFISLRLNGLVVAGLTIALLIGSPGFLELSSSCMLEIPALVPAVGALSLLLTAYPQNWKCRSLLAGSLFGVAVAMKLVPVIMLPLAALIIWLGQRDTAAPATSAAKSLALVGVAMVLTFVTVDALVDAGAFLTHIRQTWVSHFAPARSSEYGSAADHSFEWVVLARNWDTTVPALVGIGFLLRQLRQDKSAILPLAWLGMMLAIFAYHRPWWSYYYVHLAIPLCWCAAIGLKETCQRVSSQVGRGMAALLAVYVLGAWIMVRVYLEVMSVRHSPQTYSSPVLAVMERFRPFTEWLYTEEPVYSFHAGIPLPPDLGVVMLKRLWSGEMTNAKIAAELKEFQPGMILLPTDANLRPFQDLITETYQLVYADAGHRLYVHRSIVNKVAL